MLLKKDENAIILRENAKSFKYTFSILFMSLKNTLLIPGSNNMNYLF